MMITSSKCRPRNSAGRFCITALPYQIGPLRLQQIPTNAFESQTLSESRIVTKTKTGKLGGGKAT
jgi:hypothetical protein